MTYLLVGALVAVIASLAAALFWMLRSDATDTPQATGTPEEAQARDKRRGAAMARALAVRVALSIALFACILIGWKLGYLQPHGIPLRGQ